MKKVVYFNLSFDDFHPQVHPDFGGDPTRGIFKQMTDLLKEFPGLKITHFTPANWIDRPRVGPRPWYLLKQYLGLRVVGTEHGEPYRLDRHPEWCAKVRELVLANRFEIAAHGYSHCNPRRFSHGQEFADLDTDEAVRRLLLTEETFARCGIPFVKGFRPPGWGISAGMFEALRKLQYRFICLFPSRIRLRQVGFLEGMAVLPQNYSIAEAPEVALREAEHYGLVFAKGHVVYRYGWEILDNGINDQTWANLRATLQLLNERYEVRYVTMSEYLDIAMSHRGSASQPL